MLDLSERRRGDTFVRVNGLHYVAPGLWKMEVGGVVYRIFTRGSAYGVRTDSGRELGRVPFKGIGRPEAFAKAVLMIADDPIGRN